jgi:thiamine biosynthesis lipoprotein
MNNLIKYLAVVLLCLVVGCGTKNSVPQKFKLQGEALGTTYGISYIATSESLDRAVVDSLIFVVNQSMSTYWPDSDISKINKGDKSVSVEFMFKEVFLLSKDIYEASGGYFDPTVGTLVNAWGFGPGTAIKMSPTAVDSLMSYVGYNKVRLNGSFIEKEKSEIYFDFNAIAKGYAIDRIGVVLDQLGIENYLIELGGELLAKGMNVAIDTSAVVSQKKWLVGIDHPQNEDRNKPITLVQLQDGALASSGNYRKFREDPLTGEKYVHTINPLSGYTENSSTLAASVLAPTCAIADGYATAFMAMGYEKAIKLVERNPTLEAFFIYIDPATGVLTQYMSPGFKEVVFEQKE